MVVDIVEEGKWFKIDDNAGLPRRGDLEGSPSQGFAVVALVTVVHSVKGIEEGYQDGGDQGDCQIGRNLWDQPYQQGINYRRHY